MEIVGGAEALRQGKGKGPDHAGDLVGLEFDPA
jgi:hypothetical protein